jgi:hypothetical protein
MQLLCMGLFLLLQKWTGIAHQHAFRVSWWLGMLPGASNLETTFPLMKYFMNTCDVGVMSKRHSIRVGSEAQVVACLPSKCTALSSNSSTTKIKKRDSDSYFSTGADVKQISI